MYRFAGIAAALATVTFAAPMHAAPITDLKETATWKTGAAGVRSERAGITFPIQAGVLRFLSAGKNDSNELDLNAQYASEDGGIVGTVFLYRPTHPDNGLA